MLSGQLQVTGDDQPRAAAAGSMFAAPRGHRHRFSNPCDSDALALGVWAPAQPAIAFIRDIGAALIPGTPPGLDEMHNIYAGHASRLSPRPHGRSANTRPRGWTQKQPRVAA